MGVIYQLSWKTLPGLRGISCSDFRAVPTEAPGNPALRHGAAVILEFASEAECEALIRRLEEHFGPQRYSNSAAAFEGVKAYVLEWAASWK